MGLLPAAAAALPADVQRPLYVLPPLFPHTRSVVRRRILELGQPGILVRHAAGAVPGTLFEDAPHALASPAEPRVGTSCVLTLPSRSSPLHSPHQPPPPHNHLPP